jgi:ketosteroid isomerase-like protein
LGILRSVAQKNVEIVKGIFRMWERGHFTDTEWADPEIEFSIPGPDPRVHRGIEAMGQAWAEWLDVFDELTIELTEIHEVGDLVVAGQEFHATGRGSRIPVDLPGAATLTLRDGKVIRFAGHITLEDALADAESQDGPAPRT